MINSIAALTISGDCLLAQAQQTDSVKSLMRFKDAIALSIDPSGMIYVIDQGTNEVFKLEGRKLLSHIGGYGWNKENMDHPKDIISPNGLDIFIADYSNHRILRYDRNLALVSQIPSPEIVQNQNRLFGYPLSVAFLRFGKLFIIDGDNNRLISMTNDNTVDKIIGGIDAGKGKLVKPRKVRISNQDHIYVLDGNQIRVFDIFGNILTTIGKDIFQNVISFAIVDSTLYILDSCSIFRVNPSGIIQRMMNISKIRGDCSDIRDIFVHGQKLYILSNKELFYLTNFQEYDHTK